MIQLDPKFKSNKAAYILQCSLATLAVLCVLTVLDVMVDTTVIASLGATSFIAFATPHANLSRPRYMVGGYCCGIICGSLFNLISCMPAVQRLALLPQVTGAVFGALAVGLSIFMMVVANYEHPPAAGLALGIVLNPFSLWVIAVVLIGVVLIAFIKTALKPYLKNLI